MLMSHVVSVVHEASCTADVRCSDKLVLSIGLLSVLHSGRLPGCMAPLFGFHDHALARVSAGGSVVHDMVCP